jgi:vancomycin resistance protein YoaR
VGMGMMAGRIAAVVTATVLAGAVTLTVIAGAWGGTLRDEARLLPGTLIAGVDVSGATEAEARDRAMAALASALDAPVALAHLDDVWSVTPRELGASTDLDARLATARQATEDATLPRLVRLRWTTVDSRTLEVGIDIPQARIDAFVDDIADELDLTPTDATLRWVDGAPSITDDADGLEVDRAATVATLTDALRGTPADDANDAPLAVTTEVLRPDVSTATVTAAGEATASAIDDALDRTVTVQHRDRTWRVTPRELDATPVGEPVVAAALRGDALRGDALNVELVLPDASLDALVGEFAGALDVAPVHANVSYRGGVLQTTQGRDGYALDRDGARTSLLAALRGDAETVTLELGTVRARAGSDVGDVLLVRQSQRVVELHRGGTMVRSWPVAVGTGGSPTPTGTFTVGAKRFEPTWNNPALDRWGKDMPARIGPGPDNPLGLRALNWNRPGGGDTLIRFHGTPNEASIGSASSNGCVRMFNADVIELYDLVPSGATILSVA